MTQRRALLTSILTLIACAAHAQPLVDRIPPNGASLRIERSANLPASFVAALRRANCLHDDAMLFTFPIELFRPAARA